MHLIKNSLDTQVLLLNSQLHENWKFHKPRIASYWLVKLDSIKRRKVSQSVFACTYIYTDISTSNKLVNVLASPEMHCF